MTNLLIKFEQMPLPIDISSLTTILKVSDQQFYDFCRMNPDLRIERNANGEIIIMPPAFDDTGNSPSRKAIALVQPWMQMHDSELALTDNRRDTTIDETESVRNINPAVFVDVPWETLGKLLNLSLHAWEAWWIALLPCTISFTAGLITLQPKD